MTNKEWIKDKIYNHGWRRNLIVLPPDIYQKVIAYRDVLMNEYRESIRVQKFEAKRIAAQKGEQ